MSRILRTLGVAALAAFAGGELALAKTEAYFARETSLTEVAKAELGTARHRVDAALPDLSDEPFVDQLVALADRKIAVRVLVSSTGDAKCKACDRLELHGADVRITETRMLHRFAVVDGPRGKQASGVLAKVLLLNGSLARGGRDASLVAAERDGDVALAFQDQFNFLWGIGRDHDDKAKAGKSIAVHAPAAAPALFSSANMVPLELEGGWLLSPMMDLKSGAFAAYLSSAIDHAYEQVLVASPSLKSLEVYQALTRALERGVMVRVLVDGKEMPRGKGVLPNCLTLARSDLRSMDECLASLGADVRYARGNGRGVTTAFVAIDGRTVHTGNFRLSRVSELKALGSVLTLKGESAKSFVRHFEKSFAMGTALPRKKQVKPLAAAASVPSELKGCVGIRPASLSFAEMRKWRAIYQRGMCE